MDLVSAFAASAYARSKFDFSEADFDKHHKNACKLSTISADRNAFWNDLIRSTSLCLIDGSKLKFNHRTFQEYFAARYIFRKEDKKAVQAINEIFTRYESDIVMDFLFSMNKPRFEAIWVSDITREFTEKARHVTGSIMKYKRVIHDPMLKNKIECLRYLYRFEPHTHSINAALDAIISIQLETSGVEPNDEELTDFRNLMSADVNNFFRLHEELSGRVHLFRGEAGSAFGDISDE